MSALAEQIQAAKARQMRFAQAAIRYEENSKIKFVAAAPKQERAEFAPIQECEASPPAPKRRHKLSEYSKAFERESAAFATSLLVKVVVRSMADEFGVTPAQVMSKRRGSLTVSTARHFAVGIMREVSDLSLPRLGRAFGREHSTILNSLSHTKVWFAEESIRGRVDQIKAEILS